MPELRSSKVFRRKDWGSSIHRLLAVKPLCETMDGINFTNRFRYLEDLQSRGFGTHRSNFATAAKKVPRRAKTFGGVDDLHWQAMIVDKDGKFNEEFLDVYLQPKASNFTSVDSLNFTKISGHTTLVLHQHTVSEDYPIKVSGLEEIYLALPAAIRYGAGGRRCLVLFLAGSG